MALVTLLCLWVIGSVLSAVLKNVMEFGNSAISAKLEGIMHTTHLDSVVNNVHLRSSNSDNVFENKIQSWKKMMVIRIAWMLQWMVIMIMILMNL